MGASLPTKHTLLGTSPGIQMPFISGDPLEGEIFFRSPNTQPRARIYYYLAKDVEESESMTLSLIAPDRPELTLASGSELKRKKGLNRYDWNPRIEGMIAPAGKYIVKLRIGNEEFRTPLEILEPKSY
jgi:hypothetical protein